MTKVVVFVGSNTTGSGPPFVHAAKRRGFDAVLLASDPDKHAWAAEHCVRVVRTDTSDFAAVLDACRNIAANAQLVAVTSTADGLIATAALAARTLGLPGPNPEVLLAAGDKLNQRQAFAREGVPSPAWAVARDAVAAATAFNAFGRIAVIKPLRGSGSVGTRLVRGADEAAYHAQGLLDGALSGRIQSAVLVEQFVAGPQYSVESFGGVTVGVTHNHIGPEPSFVEVGHDFPASLEPTLREAIERAAADAVRALDVGWGPAHVEVRVGPSDPVVIEVNSRLGGGMLFELVRLAHGVDLVSATLGAWLGETPDLSPCTDRVASLRAVLAPRRGRLASVDADALPRDVMWVTPRRVGDVVGGFGDFRDRVGYVIATGRDVHESGGAATHWASQVRVAIDHKLPEERP